MQCQKCGFVAPQVKGIDACVKCGGPLAHSTEELLSDPSLGLVKEIRPGQIALAKIIDEAIQEQGHTEVFAEGGCGIGKTFAYLVPALKSGMRIVVVTAKKSLQDQLEVKDIPYLREKLGLPKTFVSLKGKSNYICKKQLRKNRALFDQHGHAQLWEALTTWADEEGNIGDLNSFPGETPFPTSTVTAEECTGNCKFSRKRACGYRHMKNEAKEADLVITNHSMLGFDLRFGVGRLFNPYNILIIDEAHACPDFFRRAFASEVSETWMKTFLRKAGREQIDTPNVKEKGAVAQWAKLFKSIPDTRLLQPGFFNTAELTRSLDTLTDIQRDFEDYAMSRWMPGLYAELQTAASGDPNAIRVGRPSTSTVMKDCEENILRKAHLDGMGVEDDSPEIDVLNTLIKLYNNAAETREILKATTEADENFINSREITSGGKVKVSRQPVNLAPFVAGPLKQIDKVIFTSATLNGALLKSELGVTPKVEVTQPSPFNYRASALVYIPQHLPRPNDDEFHFEAAQDITQLLNASKGNALVLFSARTDLDGILQAIEQYYDVDARIFAQTTTHRPKEVMQAFERTDNSVIFGLRSFFEGIDVQGMKLRLVILVKIPFPHMKDPLCQAKKQRLGGKWWNEYYYPMMLNDVQQAAGRLIRTHADKGVLAILDVRMWVGGNKDADPKLVGTHKNPWKGYGYRIFKALPFENFTPDRNLAIRFLKKLAGTT